VINPALASVSVSFPAAQRIESKLNRGPSKIKKDAANSFIVHEHTAVSLLFMMVLKIILRQSEWINTVINHGFPHVPNAEAIPAKPARELNVLGSSRSSRPKSLVKGPDLLERSAGDGKICTIE
jgi:hypothetical protein